MNITMIGAGYVGLVTAACFAEMGNHVVCVDNDARKVARLNRGEIPLYEPKLEGLVHSNAKIGRLQFITDLGPGIAHATVIFIAVGTPSNPDGSADLQHVRSVAKTIGEQLGSHAANNGNRAAPCVVVTKSTVPVGTTEQVHQIITHALRSSGSQAQVRVASNPEFLKQGAAVDDFMKPDRIIIGAEHADSVEILRALYAPFNRNHARIISMDLRSAELTKYAANGMLATKISYMNEIANLAECVGADVEAVRTGIGADPRIGREFIYPGCGYGGSCFPKDVRALCQTATQSQYHPRLLSAVNDVNEAQKAKPLEKALRHFGDDLDGKIFALWGLAFKANTDDMREAPSRVIVEGLWAHGAKVQGYDPQATPQAREIYGERDDLALYCDDPYAALSGADALIVVTEWHQLRAADPQRIKNALRGSVVIDGRNLYPPQPFRDAGLTYYGIGRT